MQNGISQTIEGSYSNMENDKVPGKIIYDKESNNYFFLNFFYTKKTLQISLSKLGNNLNLIWEKVVYEYPYKEEGDCYGDKLSHYFFTVGGGFIYFFRDTESGVKSDLLQCKLDMLGNIVEDYKTIISVPNTDLYRFLSGKENSSLIIVPMRAGIPEKYRSSRLVLKSSFKEPQAMLTFPDKKTFNCFIFNPSTGKINKINVPITDWDSENAVSYLQTDGNNLFFNEFIMSGMNQTQNIYCYNFENGKIFKNRFAKYDYKTYSIASTEFGKFLYKPDYFIQSGIKSISGFELPETDEKKLPATVYYNKCLWNKDGKYEIKEINTPDPTKELIKQIAIEHAVRKKFLLNEFEFLKILPNSVGGYFVIAERNRDESSIPDHKIGTSFQKDEENTFRKYFAEELLVFSLSDSGELKYSAIINKRHKYVSYRPTPYFAEFDGSLFVFYEEERKKDKGGNNLYSAVVKSSGEVIYKEGLFQDYDKNNVLHGNSCIETGEGKVILWIGNHKKGRTLYKVGLN